MEKIFSNESDIDGNSMSYTSDTQEQAPSIYISELGDWMSIRYWSDVNRDYEDTKVFENNYNILFSNVGLKNHTLIDGEVEDLYLVEVIHRGSEIYIENYYYLDSLKYDRWSLTTVLEKIKHSATYNHRYEELDLDDTYFLSDINNFNQLAASIIHIIYKLGYHQPLAIPELGY